MNVLISKLILLKKIQVNDVFLSLLVIMIYNTARYDNLITKEVVEWLNICLKVAMLLKV